MAVLRSHDDRKTATLGEPDQIPGHCFDCGQAIGYPLVYWRGSTGWLALHPDCAVHIAGGIALDAHHAQRGKD